MYSKCLLVLSLAFLLAVSARSTRDAPANPETPTISNLFEVINENLKKIGDSVSKSFNAEQFEETGRDVAKQLDVWGANIKKETENLKDNEAVKSLLESVDKALDKSKNSADVKAVLEKFQEGEKILVPKINQFRETAEPQLKDLSQKVLDQTIITLQDIAKIFQQKVKQ